MSRMGNRTLDEWCDVIIRVGNCGLIRRRDFERASYVMEALRAHVQEIGLPLSSLLEEGNMRSNYLPLFYTLEFPDRDERVKANICLVSMEAQAYALKSAIVGLDCPSIEEPFAISD